MVVLGKKGINHYLHVYNFSFSILYPILFLLPLFCYFHVEPLHSSLTYCPPCEIYFCIQQSEWPAVPSLVSFSYHSSCFIFFCSSIQTAREKHSCVINGTKYSRSPTSTKPSLPTSNPLWLPGVFHLITMVIVLHLQHSPYPPLHIQLFPIRWQCFIFYRGNGSS